MPFELTDLKDYHTSFGKLIVKIWLDPTIERAFNENPIAVMKEHGLPVPASANIKASDIKIPPKPEADVIEFLAKTQRQGGGTSTAGTYSSFSCPGCTAGTAGSALCEAEVFAL